VLPKTGILTLIMMSIPYLGSVISGSPLQTTECGGCYLRLSLTASRLRKRLTVSQKLGNRIAGKVSHCA
jgi:hypothetical protein